MRPKSEEQQEKHEGRLAHALSINRVQRVLKYQHPSTFPRCKTKSKHRQTLNTARTEWTGTEWSNEQQQIGMGLLFPAFGLIVIYQQVMEDVQKKSGYYQRLRSSKTLSGRNTFPPLIHYF
jgi:hypothetical protein